MPAPLILPQSYTVDDLLRNMMKNPEVAKRARRDPKYVVKLRFQIESQMRALTSAPSSNQAAELYRRAPINSFLSASPMAAGSTSVADMVRAQREGFLMADGVQVAGDYTTEIRAEKGGIAAPRMPRVGFPAAQSYKYPSRKMITGAALAATPEARDFTSSRQPLPTASFNPGAFVMSRPDSLNNSLVVNRTVAMPSVRDLYPRGSTYAEMTSASPADERRRNMSTLLGLPEMPSVRPAPQSGLRARARLLRPGLMGFAQPGAKGACTPNYAYSVKKDPWFILTEGVEKIAVEANDSGAKPFAWLTGLVSWANPLVIPVPPAGETPRIERDARWQATPASYAAVKAWNEKNSKAVEYERNKKAFDEAKCLSFTPANIGLCTLEGLKALARGAVVNTILSDKIDFGAIKAPDGDGTLNDWINRNIVNLVPPEYRGLVEGVQLMPLDLTESPIRRYMIEQAYEETYCQPLKDEWYEAISNELRNRKSGSLATAVTIIKESRFRPGAKAPVVPLKAGAMRVSPEMNAKIDARKRREATFLERSREAAMDLAEDNTPLIIGGVAAVALIGLGIYLKGK